MTTFDSSTILLESKNRTHILKRTPVISILFLNTLDTGEPKSSFITLFNLNSSNFYKINNNFVLS